MEQQEAASQAHPPRQLGLFDCTMIVVGGMIGSGIYRPATTWPGALIVGCGVPVYFLFRRRIVRTERMPLQ